VPATVPGSKSFWTKKWLNLVAIVSEKGSADIFFTLTANDSWPELKDIISQYENPASILHPVEPTEYFFSALVQLNLLYLVLQVSLEKLKISGIELKLRIGVLSIFMVCCGLRVKYLSMQLLLKSLGVKIVKFCGIWL
jgi:hypothetical protein